MFELGGVRDASDFKRRLAVTAVALIAYRLGAHVPLPGIDTEALRQLGGSAIERISIVALGVTPLVTILILSELAKIAFPKLRQWEASALRNRDRLNRVVVGLAILTAAVQASGLALALEEVDHLVKEPGTQFRLACIATLLAGTAFVAWLADQVTRHGVGAGVWLLLITPWIAELPSRIASIVVSWPSFDPAVSLQLLLGSSLAVLLLVGIVRLMLAGGIPQTAPACLWSVLLASTVWPWALLAIAALVAGVSPAPLAWIGPDHPFGLLALAALVALFVRLCLRSQQMAGAAVAPSIPPGLLAAALAAIELGDMVIATQVGLVPLAGHLVILAAVAMSLLARWWQPAAESDRDSHQERDEVA